MKINWEGVNILLAIKYQKGLLNADWYGGITPEITNTIQSEIKRLEKDLEVVIKDRSKFKQYDIIDGRFTARRNEEVGNKVP